MNNYPIFHIYIDIYDIYIYNIYDIYDIYMIYIYTRIYIGDPNNPIGQSWAIPFLTNQLFGMNMEPAGNQTG